MSILKSIFIFIYIIVIQTRNGLRFLLYSYIVLPTATKNIGTLTLKLNCLYIKNGFMKKLFLLNSLESCLIKCKHMGVEEIVYFFQPDHSAVMSGWSMRRARKILDEQTKLSLTNNSKKNLGSIAKLTQEIIDPNSSITDRLKIVLNTVSRSSVSALTTSRNQIEWQPATANNQTYTDTRLQAVKYLTEDMIRELDEAILAASDLQVTLPGQVIYDWHADWSDLTEKAEYSHFPMWQTKNGKDGDARTTIAKDEVIKSSKYINKKKSKNQKIKRTITMEQVDEDDIELKTHQQELLTKTGRRRLQSIASSKADSILLIDRRQSLYRVNSILGTTRSIKNTTSPQPPPFSRTTMVSQNSSGFSMNYQLSSKVFREKGWTVLKIDRNEIDYYNEKKILALLTNSLRSM